MRDILPLAGWTGSGTPEMAKYMRLVENRIHDGVDRAFADNAFLTWNRLPEPSKTPERVTMLDTFLSRLADAKTSVPAHHVALVVALPGDETLHCGATLARLRGAHIVIMSDGVAPSPETNHANLAMTKWRELQAALDMARIAPSAAMGFGMPQGQIHNFVDYIARRLARFFFRSGTALVLTHAYKGVDRERDATARAVHAAVKLCAAKGQSIAIVEMPLTRQRTGENLVLQLDHEQQELKQRMLVCFSAQLKKAHTLGLRASISERFRIAPDYDFAAELRANAMVNSAGRIKAFA